jgi:hypothetical protein
VLLVLIPTFSSSAEPNSKTEWPTYEDGRPVKTYNQFIDDILLMKNESKSSVFSSPGPPPEPQEEKNNWGQYMKDYYRSGRYLTQQTDFFGRQIAVHQILSFSGVTASPIMLNNDEVGGTLCKERIGPVNIYYCTIIGHDDGTIVAEESNKINYAPSWETSVSTLSPISSFAAHPSNTDSKYFWVATTGILGSKSPIIEYRKTYDGNRVCPTGSLCTIIFNGGRIKAPMLYLPRGGGGGVTEDRVYVLVEYPNSSPQKTILYALAYDDSQIDPFIAVRWSYTFSGVLAGPAGPLALWRNNEARPIIVPVAHQIYMLDERNGAFLTSTSLYDNQNQPVQIKATPSIDIYNWGFLYVPGADGKIRKFDITIAYAFNLVWTTGDLTIPPKSQSIFSSIANRHDSIYVAIYNGYNTNNNGKVMFYRIRKSDGSQVWSRWEYSNPQTIPEVYASPAVTPLYVFFVVLGPQICPSGAWEQLSIDNGQLVNSKQCIDVSDYGAFTPTAAVISRVVKATDNAIAFTGTTKALFGLGFQYP